MVLDLADLRSVRDFAAKWEESGKEVDALIANAGVMAVYPQQFTADGFELTMAVNHLGHFLLVCLLEPAIRAGSVNGRCVSSPAQFYVSRRCNPLPLVLWDGVEPPDIGVVVRGWVFAR